MRLNLPGVPITKDEMLSLLAKISGERQEHFVVICLDSGGRLINSKIVFIGTVTSMVVHPREIFAQAIADYAVSIVVAHNHPSGNPNPSKEDIATTQQLIAAGLTSELSLKTIWSLQATAISASRLMDLSCQSETTSLPNQLVDFNF